jgi:hypothetical protein
MLRYMGITLALNDGVAAELKRLRREALQWDRQRRITARIAAIEAV